MKRPVAIGLLLCEQVIIEENTRNITPVNCFTRRTVERFPAETVPFVLFALLTDGLGEMPLEVVIYRLDAWEEIFRGTLPIRFTHPLEVVRCMLRVRDCSFPAAGHYQVSLLVSNEVIAQQKLIIQKKEESS